MINRENCRVAADYIRRQDVPFWMANYTAQVADLRRAIEDGDLPGAIIESNDLTPVIEGSCGTVGCIAGSIVLMMGRPERGWSPHHIAADFLGLDIYEADELFVGLGDYTDHDGLDLYSITKVDAVRHLEMLADGKLDRPDWGQVLDRG